jgi:chromosome segregation ATPase
MPKRTPNAWDKIKYALGIVFLAAAGLLGWRLGRSGKAKVGKPDTQQSITDIGSRIQAAGRTVDRAASRIDGDKERLEAVKAELARVRGNLDRRAERLADLDQRIESDKARAGDVASEIEDALAIARRNTGGK